MTCSFTLGPHRPFEGYQLGEHQRSIRAAPGRGTNSVSTTAKRMSWMEPLTRYEPVDLHERRPLTVRPPTPPRQQSVAHVKSAPTYPLVGCSYWQSRGPENLVVVRSLSVQARLAPNTMHIAAGVQLVTRSTASRRCHVDVTMAADTSLTTESHPVARLRPCLTSHQVRASINFTSVVSALREPVRTPRSALHVSGRSKMSRAVTPSAATRAQPGRRRRRPACGIRARRPHHRPLSPVTSPMPGARVTSSRSC